MQKKQHRKTVWSWYLLNLLGWAVGISWGFNFSTFYLVPKLSPSMAYRFGSAIQLGFPLLVLIICVGLAQWLMLKQWKVKVDIYKWIAANIKGAIIAFVILFMFGAFVGALQRPILDFLYGNHTTSAQTDLILKLIFIGLPLLGSVGTSAMVAIDVLKLELRKKNVTQVE